MLIAKNPIWLSHLILAKSGIFPQSTLDNMNSGLELGILEWSLIEA